MTLPVSDLTTSRRFFEELNFSFDERTCDGQAACMIINEQAFVLLLSRERFAEFVTRPVADPHRASAFTVAISAESRDAVDALTASALAAGAAPAKEILDLGFMYQRSFRDHDGHIWEVLWMDPPGEKGSSWTRHRPAAS
ncbi:MAG: VOC family protein [Solirubrobacterales bacterium]